MLKNKGGHTKYCLASWLELYKTVFTCIFAAFIKLLQLFPVFLAAYNEINTLPNSINPVFIC